MQDLSQLTEFWSSRKVPNLQWGDSLRLERLDFDFLDQMQKLDIKTGLTLVFRVDSLDEALETLKRHVNGG